MPSSPLAVRAANVVGDGQHTIERIDCHQNDQSSAVGRDHRSPLEISELGTLNCSLLDQQGYGPDDILPAGVKVDLRRNSNISGGDSIDVTDSMHPSYKELRCGHGRAMGSLGPDGVDLIIPDSSAISTKENPNCTYIELNFNPSMYMHTYCAEGRDKALLRKYYLNFSQKWT